MSNSELGGQPLTPGRRFHRSGPAARAAPKSASRASRRCTPLTVRGSTVISGSTREAAPRARAVAPAAAPKVAGSDLVSSASGVSGSYAVPGRAADRCSDTCASRRRRLAGGRRGKGRGSSAARREIRWQRCPSFPGRTSGSNHSMPCASAKSAVSSVARRQRRIAPEQQPLGAWPHPVEQTIGPIAVGVVAVPVAGEATA